MIKEGHSQLQLGYSDVNIEGLSIKTSVLLCSHKPREQHVSRLMWGLM